MIVSGDVPSHGLLKLSRSSSLAPVCWLEGSRLLAGDSGLSWKGWRGLGGKKTAVGPLLP